MLAKVFRGYWYAGHPGYEGIFRPQYHDKRAKITDLSYITDPIDHRIIRGPISPFSGEQCSVETVIQRLRHKQDLDVSAGTAAYLAFNGALRDIKDDYLWKEVDFNVMRKFSELDDRMLYGCMYGLMRMGQGKVSVLEAVIDEFDQRILPNLTPFEIYHIIEACCLNDGSKYDSITYMHEKLMPRFKENFKRCRFLHIDSYLLKLLFCMNYTKYYEKWLWEKILELFQKKGFGDLYYWEIFYKIFMELDINEIKTETGVDMQPFVVHLENIWHKSPDHQWKYNLAEKRYFNIHEMIDRVKDTKNEITWQEGEEMIKHNLPKWYWDSDLNINEEYADLYAEYMKNKE